ncbi:hypothetical protein ScPMuIL_001401 [Solemya velum]
MLSRNLTISLLLIAIVTPALIADQYPAFCKRRYEGCMKKKWPEDKCNIRLTKCLANYCIIHSKNTFGRVSFLTRLFECGLRHGLIYTRLVEF